MKIFVLFNSMLWFFSSSFLWSQFSLLGLLLFQIWLGSNSPTVLWFQELEALNCILVRFCRWEALVEINGEQKGEVTFSTSCCRNCRTLYSSCFGIPSHGGRVALLVSSNAASAGHQWVWPTGSYPGLTLLSFCLFSQPFQYLCNRFQALFPYFHSASRLTSVFPTEHWWLQLRNIIVPLLLTWLSPLNQFSFFFHVFS